MRNSDCRKKNNLVTIFGTDFDDKYKRNKKQDKTTLPNNTINIVHERKK